MVIALGIVILVLAAALCLLVLMQSGKDSRLSGAIAGGMDTFFGKSKTSSTDRKLAIATVVVSCLFAVAVLALYMIA